MAHPYTTSTIMEEVAGTALVQKLGDFANDDDLADANVLAGVIERADNEIDARLGKRYTVPFAAQPSTPGIIADISSHLALYQLISQRHPGNSAAEFHRDQALELLEGLLSGEFTVPGASEVDADDAAVGLSYDAGTNVFQGRDSDDADRMGQW